MKFVFNHSNINVANMARSVAFYEQSLGLTVQRRVDASDGSFTLVFMGDDVTSHRLELTWLRDHEGSYDLGDNESHLCFSTDDIDAARKHHESMGCVSYVNEAMSLYFIEDPDGYWTEIVPGKPD